MLSLRLPIVLCCALVTLLAGGCRLAVPIHVWQPPELGSTVGHRVIVSDIVGPQEIADRIEATLINSAPQDRGRATTLLASDRLESKSPIQLVSATDEQPNDLALAAVARQEGIDFLLRGELLHDSISDQSQPTIKLSWRLTSLTEQDFQGGKPVVMNVESALERYPDLSSFADREAIVATAAARETFRLITPWVDRQRIELSIPYLLPGSAAVRRGNAAAHAGQWDEAQQIWSTVAGRHPGQTAAIHNLALAAAAAQDFSRGKQLARQAVRRQPTDFNKRTLVWIEMKQRQYHDAFQLPDPPEGWFLTR